ncbi:MAG TPA: RIP metalloprotease RseP [Anaeromyxobacteraceae bacterium]|nr:RIP metalloprotease RseP [Anaeromyxobacteraceae bacterium]
MTSLDGAGQWLLTAGVTVLGFAVLIVIHELGHFAVARLAGMRVERFSVGFGPVLWSRRRGDTEWCLSALPLGGYVRIAGMAPGEEVDPADRGSYANHPAWHRFLVILAGPAMNYLLALCIAVGMFATLGLPQPDPAPVAGDIIAGSAAERAGLRAGDRVLAFDGKPIATWNELVAAVQNSPGRTVELSVRRAGAPAEAAPERVAATPDDRGGVGQLGVRPALIAVRAGPGQALALGVRRTNAQAASILAGLVQVVTGRQKAELRGPLGIAQEMARSARAGALQFVMMLWFISIVLALFNLLPIPALDGGRLTFLGYELVARRPVNQKVENVVHLIGAVALIGLLLAVTVFGDLARLFRR